MPTPAKPAVDLQADQQLQEAFDRFVEFGTLLDRRTRQYLVRYLRAKLGLGEAEPEALEDTYYRYFTKALDKIFGDEDLVKICLDRPSLSRQIAADTLAWIRRTHAEMNNGHPYEDEARRLRATAGMPLRMFWTRKDVMLDFLKHQYPQEDFDTGFYRHKFAEIMPEGPEKLTEHTRQALERVLGDFLAQWDALLQARILEHQLKQLEEAQEDFSSLMEAKLKEYEKLEQLLSPFTDYIGRYWDLSRDLWQDANLDLLQRYEELLQNEVSVQELVDLLGRMREAELISDSETLERVILHQTWKPADWLPAEVVGVHSSDDLSRMLSSEAALLSDPDTEDLFLRKFVEKELQTLRMEDQVMHEDPEHETETFMRVRKKEKGPFLVCVDTSDSMTGRPEHIAKVLCFAILKMAAQENRRAFLINFSVGVKTIDLYDIGRSLDELVAFLQMSFHGGTDISLALHEVMRQLRTEAYEDADVLVISDFIMYRIDEDILKQVQHQQTHKGTRFHSLTLYDAPNTEVIEVFDSNWMYDPAEKGIMRELEGNMRSLRGR